MSILIKGMKMSHSCIGCRFCEHGSINEWDLYCGIDNKHIGNWDDKHINNGWRRHDCPLVEVPTPHGRLIDVDELEDKLNAWTQENFSFSDRYQFNLEGMIRASDFAMALPTIIEAEEGEEA